jgi:hypothetical protein
MQSECNSVTADVVIQCKRFLILQAGVDTIIYMIQADKAHVVDPQRAIY